MLSGAGVSFLLPLPLNAPTHQGLVPLDCGFHFPDCGLDWGFHDEVQNFVVFIFHPADVAMKTSKLLLQGGLVVPLRPVEVMFRNQLFLLV